MKRALLIIAILALPPALRAQTAAIQDNGQAAETQSAAPANGGEKKDRVIALSMGKQITESDIQPDERLSQLNSKSLDEVAFADWLKRAKIDKLTELIFVPILGQYGKENRIEATAEEIDAFIAESKKNESEAESQFRSQKEDIEKQLSGQNVAPSERKKLESQLETLNTILDSKKSMEERARGQFGDDYENRMKEIDRNIARESIVAWKLNKALFDRYGGRVVYQRDGAEPLEAYSAFLADQKKSGAFGIYDADLEAAFWDYFQNESLHNFYTAEESHEIMKRPWWEREPPAN